MREQIQAYVNGLFADAALTIRNAGHSHIYPYSSLLRFTSLVSFLSEIIYDTF